jgi:hypothetical protein
VTYRDSEGTVGQRLLYRDDESTLSLVEAGKAWSFDGDGALLRLASEALRIRNAHLFDPHELEITLEVQAKIPDGAPADVRRIIEENCKTLKFKTLGFEEE